jgi:hypothetical protein
VTSVSISSFFADKIGVGGVLAAVQFRGDSWSTTANETRCGTRYVAFLLVSLHIKTRRIAPSPVASTGTVELRSGNLLRRRHENESLRQGIDLMACCRDLSSLRARITVRGGDDDEQRTGIIG